MAKSSTESEQVGSTEGEASGVERVVCAEKGEVTPAQSRRSHVERVAGLLAEGDQQTSTDEIQALREQRNALNLRKRQVTKQLRNESRKRARMLQRSAQLTNEDLVEVLQIRQARAASKAKAKAAA